MSDDKEKKTVEIKLVWGGTGESKDVKVPVEETAGKVFEEVYDDFHQKSTPEDKFEVNDKAFERSEFGLTVEQLIHRFGEELVFEVIPPTSGA